MRQIELEAIMEGDEVEIEITQRGQRFLFKSSVQHVIDGAVLITPIEHEGKKIGFSEDMYKKLVIVSEGSPYVWEDPVIKLVKYAGEIFHLIYLQGNGKYLNRRQSFRQFIGEEMILSLMEDGAIKETMTVLVRDVSESGFGFLTDKQLHVGDDVQLRVKLVKEVMYLKAKVVRVQDDDKVRGTIYGCKLTGIVPRLSQYIMDIQREKLKGSRNAPARPPKDNK